MGTHVQKIDISKSFTFPQNIECEEPPSLSSNEGIFNPLRRNIQFFQPSSGRSSKFLTPLTSRPPPYCWVKNDQPLSSMKMTKRAMILLHCLVSLYQIVLHSSIQTQAIVYLSFNVVLHCTKHCSSYDGIQINAQVK